MKEYDRIKNDVTMRNVRTSDKSVWIRVGLC